MTKQTQKRTALLAAVLPLLAKVALSDGIAEGQMCFEDEVVINYNKAFMDLRWSCESGLQCMSVRGHINYRGNAHTPGEVQPVGICTKPLAPETGENPCFKLANGIYPGFWFAGEVAQCSKEKPMCDPTVVDQGGHLKAAGKPEQPNRGSAGRVADIVCKELDDEGQRDLYTMFQNTEAFV